MAKGAKNSGENVSLASLVDMLETARRKAGHSTALRDIVQEVTGKGYSTFYAVIKQDLSLSGKKPWHSELVKCLVESAMNVAGSSRQLVEGWSVSRWASTLLDFTEFAPEVRAEILTLATVSPIGDSIVGRSEVATRIRGWLVSDRRDSSKGLLWVTGDTGSGVTSTIQFSRRTALELGWHTPQIVELRQTRRFGESLRMLVEGLQTSLPEELSSRLESPLLLDRYAAIYRSVEKGAPHLAEAHLGFVFSTHNPPTHSPVEMHERRHIVERLEKTQMELDYFDRPEHFLALAVSKDLVKLDNMDERLLLCFDNIELSGPDGSCEQFLRLLASVVRRTRATRAILGAHADSWPGESLKQAQTNGVKIELEPLSETDARSVCAHLGLVDPARVAEVMAAASGNYRSLVTLARRLSESGKGIRRSASTDLYWKGTSTSVEHMGSAERLYDCAVVLGAFSIASLQHVSGLNGDDFYRAFSVLRGESWLETDVKGFVVSEADREKWLPILYRYDRRLVADICRAAIRDIGGEPDTIETRLRRIEYASYCDQDLCLELTNGLGAELLVLQRSDLVVDALLRITRRSPFARVRFRGLATKLRYFSLRTEGSEKWLQELVEAQQLFKRYSGELTRSDWQLLKMLEGKKAHHFGDLDEESRCYEEVLLPSSGSSETLTSDERAHAMVELGWYEYNRRGCARAHSLIRTGASLSPSQKGRQLVYFYNRVLRLSGDFARLAELLSEARANAVSELTGYHLGHLLASAQAAARMDERATDELLLATRAERARLEIDRRGLLLYSWPLMSEIQHSYYRGRLSQSLTMVDQMRDLYVRTNNDMAYDRVCLQLTEATLLLDAGINVGRAIEIAEEATEISDRLKLPILVAYSKSLNLAVDLLGSKSTSSDLATRFLEAARTGLVHSGFLGRLTANNCLYWLAKFDTRPAGKALASVVSRYDEEGLRRLQLTRRTEEIDLINELALDTAFPSDIIESAYNGGSGETVAQAKIWWAWV